MPTSKVARVAPPIHRAGRKPAVPELTDAEAEHAAERVVSQRPPLFLTDLLALLRDYLALSEERLHWLMSAPRTRYGGAYTTFTTRLGRFAQAGLVALAPPAVEVELERSGYAPLWPGNRRACRVWTLGKVGRAVARRLWGLTFVPEGYEAHVAHHTLAAEVQFRIAEAAREFRKKDYRPEGPRKCVVMDADKKFAVLAPDGMLIERLPDGGVGTAWAVEYHNEERPGRAKEKVEAYLRLMSKPDLWQYAWGLEQFPKVLVAYRYDEVRRDWARQVKELAGQRHNLFAVVSLADIMESGDKPLRLKGAGQ